MSFLAFRVIALLMDCSPTIPDASLDSQFHPKS